MQRAGKKFRWAEHVIEVAYPSWKHDADGGSFREIFGSLSRLCIGGIHSAWCGKRRRSGGLRESILYHSRARRGGDHRFSRVRVGTLAHQLKRAGKRVEGALLALDAFHCPNW